MSPERRRACGRLVRVSLPLVLTSCLPLLSGDPVSLAGQQVNLAVLHTSDVHSRLVPFDFSPLKTDVDLGMIPDARPFGGATRLAALIRRERASAGRVLHLDSGDSFQGAPIYNQKQGEAEYRFLSKLRCDASVVGNHEFDSGAVNFATQLRDAASFPVLSANYFWDDYRSPDNNMTALYGAPYTIRVLEGLRVGIIGMANLSTLNSIVEGGNSLQITPLEQNEAARAYVELLRPVTDLLVAVSHLGLHEDQDLIRGYEAYFEYGRARSFIQREYDAWQILQWYGPEGEDRSVVRVWIPGVSGLDLVVGGHLHVVLNPPQLLTDPSGRKVILAHSGAFAKYLGRLDLLIQVPSTPDSSEGAEIISHDYRVFPVDALWCDEAMHAFYRSKFWAEGEFIREKAVTDAIARCVEQEDRPTTDLLQPYLLDLDFNLALPTIFAFAPTNIERRNNSTGGDSPLGNMTADSMRKRKRVEAEIALTNSLGIRDNLYAGPLTQESMFNVFPFENTINIMYLSGTELQDLFDFVTERSAGRGCLSQAQISGARFTMDCAQVQLNDVQYPCDPNRPAEELGIDCPAQNRDGRNPWTCVADVTGGRCWAHPGLNIEVNGKPIDPFGTYKIAVNDYIAKGGSGFKVLKRNTTRLETGIPLRESLIGYMKGFCNCDDINAGRTTSRTGQPCGNLVGGQWVVDDVAKAFCQRTASFDAALKSEVGICSCGQVLAGDARACGVAAISTAMLDNCQSRTAADPVAPCTCEDVLTKNFQACALPGQPPPERFAESLIARCTAEGGPSVGTCTCAKALREFAEAKFPDPDRPYTFVCGHITQQTIALCRNPTAVAIARGIEDGRVARRVK